MERWLNDVEQNEGCKRCGGFNPTRIRQFIEEQVPVNGFMVGSYITNASPIDFTADIREIGDNPVSKRGRLPGRVDNPRLERVI